MTVKQIKDAIERYKDNDQIIIEDEQGTEYDLEAFELRDYQITLHIKGISDVINT